MTTNTVVPLILGIPEDARSMAIIDGTVKPEGIDLTCVHQFKSVRERHSGVANGTFDAGKMSTSGLIQLRARGGNQVALPVFFLRGFRQGNIFCRKDSGINTFSDLKGKTIAVTASFATTIIWVRGILHRNYGVTRDSVNWVAAEGDAVDALSSNINYRRLNQKRDVLWDMLDKGEIDAAIFPGNDGYYSFNPGGSLYEKIQKRGNLKTIQDDMETIKKYYQETGIYPTIHTITMKLDIAKQHPEVPINLLAALRKSRELAANYQSDEEKRQMAEEIELLGYDPYSNKLLDGEKRAFNTLMEFMIEDGVLKEKLPVESLFAEGTV